MRLLIYEHVSGGGFGEKPIPASVLSEGFGMLRTIISDAHAAGHSVTTILDSRIAELNPPLEADRRIPVYSFTEAEKTLSKAAENYDAAYIIAPETDDTLQALLDKLEQKNILSLNSESSAIAEVSDKMLLQQHVKRIGLSTPETIAFNPKEDSRIVTQAIKEEIGFPAVLKPADGVGCEGLSIVTNVNQVKPAIRKIAQKESNRFVAQPLIRGVTVSVSLISNGEEATPITLNKQNVSLKAPSQDSSYNGGTTPLNDPSEKSAFATAKKLIESVKGLKGYVGVDLILTDNDPVVIEINPRLTTSYVGIRKILKLNLAQALIDVTLVRRLPTKRKPFGYARFEKVKAPNPNYENLKKTYTMPELVSPPFPTANETVTTALICTQGATLQQATSLFSNAKKQLGTLLLSGGKQER